MNSSLRKKIYYYSLIILSFIFLSFYIFSFDLGFFHMVIEFTYIALASIIFSIAINTYNQVNRKDYYLIFMGISFGFVAILTFCHAISFEGVGIIKDIGKNISIQFYLMASYIQVLSVLVSTLIINTNRRIKITTVMVIYGIITFFLVQGILIFDILPITYILDSGPTYFFIITVILLSFISLITAFILYKRRGDVDIKIYSTIHLYIAANILSVFAFSLSDSINSRLFLIGHILKVMSIFLIYKAIVITSIINPNNTLKKVNQKLLDYTKMLQMTNKSLQEEINQREAIEEELMRKEEVFQAVLNSTSSGVCVTDHDLDIIYTNEVFDKIDVEHKLVLTRYLKKQLTKEDSINLRVEEIVNEGPLNHYDYLYFNDGRIFESKEHHFLKNQISFGRLWNINEITHRLKMESELRNSKQRYGKLMELLPLAIIVHDGDRVLYANNNSISVFKIKDRLELIGEKISKLFSGEGGESFSDLLSKDYKVFSKLQIINSQRDVKEVEGASISFFEEGRQLFMTVFRDITAWKEAESLKIRIQEESRLLTEIQEYDRLKTEFFSNISHELKTPLNIILGAIQLIKCENHDNHSMGDNCLKGKHIKMIKQNCYRLLRLINNLIDITRLDAGFYRVDLKNQDIISIIEAIVQSVIPYVESKGISLIFDTEVEEKVISCDADKIERILLNLLSNAIKFSKPQGIIEVNIYDKGEYIILSVKDTGIGIPEGMVNKIFERFRQVDNLMNRRAEGSGIGLSLVQALVELHGGSITVNSIYGEGSEFQITLPAKTISPDAAIHEVAATCEASIERISIEFSDIYS